MWLLVYEWHVHRNSVTLNATPQKGYKPQEFQRKCECAKVHIVSKSFKKKPNEPFNPKMHKTKSSFLTCNAGEEFSSTHQDILRDLPEDRDVHSIVSHVAHDLLNVRGVAAGQRQCDYHVLLLWLLKERSKRQQGIRKTNQLENKWIQLSDIDKWRNIGDLPEVWKTKGMLCDKSQLTVQLVS